MIKIKNYIFQEKDIRSIYKSGSLLRIDLQYDDHYLDIEATFEDIEWNYGSQEQQYNEETEQLIASLQNKNYKLQDRIKELEEENKTLKELNVCVGCDNNPDYKLRIDKAIEYIKKNTRTAPFENYKYLEIDDEEIEELLKLLKGE